MTLEKGGDDLNILYCGDQNITQGVLMSTLSLCKHCNKKLNIYILTATVGNHKAIEREFAVTLEKEVQSVNENSTVTLLDLSEKFHSYLPVANMNTRFTPLCMLRLFADEVAELPDKLLYLDTDVMCRKDISSLYNTDIEDVEIMGVPDRYGKWFFGNILKHDYLNSGVLLLNMKNIRESGLFLKCRQMCRDKKMFMPDQSALNKLANKRKLPDIYNEQGKIKPDTVLKHFTTFFKFLPYFRAVTIKPWDEDKLHSQLHVFEFDDIINKAKGVYENE